MALLLRTWVNNYGRRCCIEISHSKYTCLVNTKISENQIKVRVHNFFSLIFVHMKSLASFFLRYSIDYSRNISIY